MTAKAEELLVDALQLAATDRVELAGLLIDSLGTEAYGDDARLSWSDEIAHRLAELDNGAEKPIPWAEVRRRMTEKSGQF